MRILQRTSKFIYLIQGWQKCTAIKSFVSVTNKRRYDRDERVSNASTKRNYFILCTMAWNNRRLLELAVDFLQHITVVIMCRNINMVKRRRKVADNSNKLALLETQH